MITQAALDRALDESLPHAEGSDGRCLKHLLPWPCPMVALATDTLPNLTLMPGVVTNVRVIGGVITHVQDKWIRLHAVKAIGRNMELNAEQAVLGIDTDPDNSRARLVRIALAGNARGVKAELGRFGYAVEWVSEDEREPVLRVGPTVLAVA